MTKECRYLTPTSLCVYLGVSKSFYYRHIKDREDFPKPLKLTSTKSVFDRLQIDQWVKRHKDTK